MFHANGGGLRPGRPGLRRDRRGSHPCQSAVGRSRSRQKQPLSDCDAGPIYLTVRRAFDGRLIQDHTMTSLNVPPHSAPRRRPIAFATIAALLFVLPAASGCSKNSSSEAPASASDPVIARVNGIDIKQSDLALAEEDVGADIHATSPPANRDPLLSYLPDIIMVTQAADKKNRADNRDIKRRLAFLRNMLLMGYEL